MEAQCSGLLRQMQATLGNHLREARARNADEDDPSDADVADNGEGGRPWRNFTGSAWQPPARHTAKHHCPHPAEPRNPAAQHGLSAAGTDAQPEGAGSWV